jgi:hypothetical protein
MFTAAIAAAVLAGCGGGALNKSVSPDDVTARLNQKYVGQNIDALITDLGPPNSTLKLNSGDTGYFWSIAPSLDLRSNNGVRTASAHSCKINAVSSPTGIVTKLSTQDEDGIRGLIVDIDSSLCAKRLRMAPDFTR